MTMEERVQAVEALGFSPRQAQFLVTVALHSGYCLRRHYTAFTGTKTGKNVQRFLEGLVARQLARRMTYRLDRGYVYHLHAWPLYHALGHPNDRNRLQMSAAAIARHLMLLDVVIGDRAVRWIATEAEKVALFTTRFHVPVHALPRRTLLPEAKTSQATRYFRDKLPIGLEGDSPTVRFVYLATGASTDSFERFLCDHARLLSALPAWSIIVVHPPRLTPPASWTTIFKRFIGGVGVLDSVDVPSLLRHFRVRRAVEQENFSVLTIDDIRTYRDNLRRFDEPAIQALFARWLFHDDERIEPASLSKRMCGRLVIQRLVHSYEQFGSYAGLV
jgi:hypothetical protein